MSDWLMLLIAATAGSVLSLLGGIYLVYGKRGVRTLQRVAVPFAAGALLAAAFLDLLPEAFEAGEPNQILMFTLIGLVFFFVLERTLSWFHHHHEDNKTHIAGRRNAALVIIGDTVHNFIDGLAIGASFLVDPAVGFVTTLAIAAHEIPQEIGDFGLLLSKGMAPKKVLIVNMLSAVATVIGAVIVFGLGKDLGLSQSLLLAVTAGFFIYIASSDIIPTIHAEPKRQWANIQTIVLIIGILFVGTAAKFAHSLLPELESHTGSSSHSINDEH